jgi:protein deglycase
MLFPMHASYQRGNPLKVAKIGKGHRRRKWNRLDCIFCLQPEEAHMGETKSAAEDVLRAPQNPDVPDVMLLLGDGFEEIEAITPIDILRRANLRVLTVAVGDSLAVRGSHGIVVMADALLESVISEAPPCELLLLPGGPGVAALRQNPRVLELVRSQIAGTSAGPAKLAAICAAPLVLADAGVLRDRQVTSFPGCEAELRPQVGDYLDDRVVFDGPICTSRGAGTAEEFSLALVSWLRGADMAAQVRRSIVARS